MSLDVRLPPPSEATGSGGGTRARDATRASGAASASASRSLSSGDVAGGTARSARARTSPPLRAPPRGAPPGRRPRKLRPARESLPAAPRASPARAPPRARRFGNLSPPCPAPTAPRPPSSARRCRCPRSSARAAAGRTAAAPAPLAPLSVTQRARAKRATVPPCEFARLYAESALPAEKNSGAFGGAESIRWRRQGWPEVAFDAARWLPIFVEGARVTTEPQRMIAMEGTKQILRSTPRDVILPLVPSLVPPCARRSTRTTRPRWRRRWRSSRRSSARTRTRWTCSSTATGSEAAAGAQHHGRLRRARARRVREEDRGRRAPTAGPDRRRVAAT